MIEDDDVLELLKAHRRGDAAAAVEVGRRLLRAGGDVAMAEAWDLICNHNPDAAKFIDRAWNGIGGWTYS